MWVRWMNVSAETSRAGWRVLVGPSRPRTGGCVKPRRRSWALTHCTLAARSLQRCLPRVAGHEGAPLDARLAVGGPGGEWIDVGITAARHRHGRLGAAAAESLDCLEPGSRRRPDRSPPCATTLSVTSRRSSSEAMLRVSCASSPPVAHPEVGQRVVVDPDDAADPAVRVVALAQPIELARRAHPVDRRPQPQRHQDRRIDRRPTRAALERASRASRRRCATRSASPRRARCSRTRRSTTGSTRRRRRWSTRPRCAGCTSRCARRSVRCAPRASPARPAA